jgi:predicted O-methyltransferase YrrM
LDPENCSVAAAPANGGRKAARARLARHYHRPCRDATGALKKRKWWPFSRYVRYVAGQPKRIAAAARALKLIIDTLKIELRKARANGHFVGPINALNRVHLQWKQAKDRGLRNVAMSALDGPRPTDPAGLVDFAMNAAHGFFRPMQSPFEIGELVRLVQSRQPKHVLEIGTARGGTLLLLTESAAPGARIVSLDLPGGRNGGGYPEWKSAIYRKFPREGRTLTLVRGNSHLDSSREQVAKLAGPQGFDLIMIDADHSYDGVKRDFQLYRPLLAPGGMIVMHDILPNRFDAEIDVAPFWEEVKREYAHTRELIEDREQGVFGIGLVFPDGETREAPL